MVRSREQRDRERWAMRIEAKQRAQIARLHTIERTAISISGAVCLFAVLAFGELALGVVAQAQTPSPEPPAAATSPAPPPSASPPAAPQGFIDAFGNWVQRGVSNVGAGFGAMVGAVGGQAGQAAKGAADAASTVAKSAAEVMCRAKGYNGGTSVDFVTNEKCPPRYRLSSRDTPEGVCTMEHFVTS